MLIQHSSIRALALALALLLPACADDRGGARPLPERVGFNRDVQPILSDKCYACHGPDAKQRQADLRFDQRESALAERDGVRAVVPGDAAGSELVRRIRSDDPDYRMPPPRSGRSLSARQIAVLAKWVEQGASYEPHWAYVPVQRPAPPEVADAAWPLSPIDRFVLARLEEEGIRPSPDADPYTLARRLSFDITGLPPTPEDAEALAHDDRGDAYADYVDRLLASPHFGERMAVYWLDLVRFADTNGYNEDQHRNIYPYRDWVIAAFNDGMSFDEFTVEQLAGDLLPGATRSQRIASGYNRLNKVSTENGSQEKEFIATYAADRVRTTAAVWMGATLGCAECHDHKFDPYTSKDFYSFAAFFADVAGEAVPMLGRIQLPPEMVVPGARDEARLAELAERIAALEAERAAAVAAAGGRFASEVARWENAPPRPSGAAISAQPPFDLAEWTPLRAGGSLDASGFVRLVSPPLASDGMHRVVRTGSGDLEFLLDVAAIHFPEGEGEQMNRLTWSLQQPRGVRGFALTVTRPVGRPIGLMAAVRGGEARLVEFNDVEELTSLRVRTVWDASRRMWTFAYGVNGAPPATPFPGGEMIDSSPDEPGDEWRESLVVATIALDQLDAAGAPAQPREPFTAVIGRDVVRRYDPVADPPAEIARLRALPAAERSAAQQRELAQYYTAVAPPLARWNDEIDRLKAQQLALESALPKTLVTVATEPRLTRVLHRGDWQDESGEVVSAAVPAFLQPLPEGAAPDRLGLARWLVSPDNPLTARVLVNRLWMLFFAHGIARTVDDLGSQGARPSHPELLDWLAAELVDSGWDVKHLIRLLVTSRTYRQASTPRADLRDVDPENDLFARQSSQRLDAEMIRDNALAVSGLLSPAVGGPSVKPYQPEHYWDGVSQILPGSPAAQWTASSGAEQYRRGLYTYWKRTFLHPALAAFDAPSREECVAQRPRSNTPVQALVLLNDPTFVEAARVLAERAAAVGDDTAAQIRWAYRRTLSRPPDDDSLRILSALFDAEVEEYRAAPDAAALVKEVGFARAGREWGERPARLAALTAVCRALLNLDETITRF